jgi:hypothetical protein
MTEEQFKAALRRIHAYIELEMGNVTECILIFGHEGDINKPRIFSAGLTDEDITVVLQRSLERSETRVSDHNF